MRWLSGGKAAFASVFQLIALLAVALAQSGCWEGTTREVASTVLFLDGETTLDRGSHGDLVALSLDLHPKSGDTIEVNAEGRAGLALLPNVLIQLEHAARIKINRLELTKDGNETGPNMRARRAEIELGRGRMLVTHSWGEALARFSVTTPEGELTTPSNALFLVEAEPQKTRVTCASGWIEFRPSSANTATRIPPGSTGEWTATGSTVTHGETDPAAQEALQQALPVEQLLRELAAQKRNLLPR